VCNLVSFRKPIDVGEASLPVRERDHDGKLEAPSERVGRMSLIKSRSLVYFGEYDVKP